VPTSPTTRSRAGLRSLWPEALVVLGLTLIVVVPVWPGVFTIDSQTMLRAARENRISNWYAPVLQCVWGGLDGAGLPVGTALVLCTVGLVAAVLACFRLGIRRVPACIATALLVLWPPVYGMAGWVGRDVWFVALTVAAVAAMGWAIRRPRHRWPLLGGAFAAAWFAADARQNGFPVLVAVGGLMGWAWARQARATHTWLRVCAGALAALVVGLGTHAVVARIATERTYAPDEILYWQDLVAMSLRRDELVFPASLRTADLTAIREAWIEGQVGSVVYPADPLVDYAPYTAGHGDEVRAAWARAVLDHPIDYLIVRADLATKSWGLRSGNLSAWFDRSDALNRASRELRQRFTGLADARANYLDAFDRGRGTPGVLHMPWLYLLVGIIGSVALLVVGASARVFGVATLALQVLLQGVLVVAAPLVEFRFQYFQVVLGPVIAGVGLVSWWRARHGDDPWAAAPPSDRRQREHGPDEALSPGRA